MTNQPKIFLSYCQENDGQANDLEFELKTRYNIKVIRDVRDLKAFGSVKDFMEKVRESDFVIKLISKEYLESESCMYEVIRFIKDDNNLLNYLDRTIPIILPSAQEGKHNIFKPAGKLYWTKYWAEKHKSLFDQYQEFLNSNFAIDLDVALKELRNDIHILKTISECISNEFLTYMLNHKLVVSYNGLLKSNYQQIIGKIDPNSEAPAGRKNSPNKHERISRLNERFKLIAIVDNPDPKYPEYPPEDPKFPATYTRKIAVDGFKNVLLKDESSNPTGTHKDRMAYEVLRKLYKPLLKSNIANDKSAIPHLSIISSGSAALAIQRVLNTYNLPKLKVLCDFDLRKDIYNFLDQFGCELYQTDLSAKALSSSEILELTDNRNGIDISSRDMLDPINYVFYDWLSYEILNSRPDYVFVPFGTGDLFSNIVNISVRESMSKKHDKRLKYKNFDYSKINFVGVTTQNKDTALDKLYSPFLPFSKIRIKELNHYKVMGVCGSKSNVRFIDESYVKDSLAIAKKLEITCEPSGISSLAMLLQMEPEIPKDSKILLVNTGKLKIDSYELS